MTPEELDSRDYSYCTAMYTDPLRWQKFLVGTPSRPEARVRALQFAVEHWGVPDDVDVYPRNYIKEARHLFAAGMHD